MKPYESRWRQVLESRQQQGLIRQRPTLSSSQGVLVGVEGKEFLSFCSNDYLGLADHPAIALAAKEAIKRYGVGSGASHLVIGHHQEHEELERELAAFTKRQRALVFSSGYMANMAVITALASKQSIVLQDRLNHASLIDGGLLSGARFQRYLHNDPQSLNQYLQRFADRSEKLVITDGVFSMDGDVAPLTEIARVCDRYEAILIVDDAHGLGVLGNRGAGTLDALNLNEDEVPVLIGTFGKAFGTAGAFVAGSEALIELLIQTARPYIYTTAQPPAIAAATRASLKIVGEADDLRERLFSRIEQFRQGAENIGLSLLPSRTAIQPVLVGDTSRLIRIAAALKAKGILVGAIRPPTIPKNTDRLRITLSASHTPDQVNYLLEALEDSVRHGLLERQ